MADAIATLRHAYAHRDEAARAWKAGGGKVLGYFEDDVPEELVLAAGFLPYRLSGDPEQPTDTLKKYLYPFWKKHGLSDRQVKLGFQLSMLDLIFRGRYDFVDYLVIPYSRKGVMGYWQQLHDAEQGYPELKLPERWFLDRAMTPGFNSSLFNQARVVDFKAQLEAWTGATITDEAVAEAITLTNAIRAATASLNGLRAGGRVSGTDALALTGAGRLIPRADYLALLEDALAALRDAPVRSGPRLFIAGSPQDNDQLYRAVEASGATIVGENHYWGGIVAEYPVDPAFPPVIAVGDQYHKKPASSVTYPIQRAIDDVVRRAQAAGAQGVVFSVYADDNQEIWAVPDTIDALAAAGIPSLYLQQQPYRLDVPDRITAEVGAFAATLGDAR